MFSVRLPSNLKQLSDISDYFLVSVFHSVHFSQFSEIFQPSIEQVAGVWMAPSVEQTINAKVVNDLWGPKGTRRVIISLMIKSYFPAM